MPTLTQFRTQYPHIAIDIAGSNDLVDLEKGEADVAIRLGHGGWSGLRADKLFEESLTTVCSPSVAPQMEIETVAAIGVLDLIQTTTRPDAWLHWMARNNLGYDISTANKISCQDFFISIQAAILGQGLAVVPSFLVEQELADGRLIDPFQLPVKGAQAYYFVSTPEIGERKAVRELREWLRQATYSPYV